MEVCSLYPEDTQFPWAAKYLTNINIVTYPLDPNYTMVGWLLPTVEDIRESERGVFRFKIGVIPFFF